MLPPAARFDALSERAPYREKAPTPTSPISDQAGQPAYPKRKRASQTGRPFAVWTGLEPATSAVTGRHSNQLNYQTLVQLSSFLLDCDGKYTVIRREAASYRDKNLLFFPRATARQLGVRSLVQLKLYG